MTDDGRAVDRADALIAILGLRPHPEGGWYAETWRARATENARPAGSAILFLLRAGETSRWHRIDATEIWHHCGGAPLELRIALPSGSTSPEAHLMGADLAAGERPQVVVPPGAWQTAGTLGAWTLVGCTAVPAFEFAGFELAPVGWAPDETRERDRDRPGPDDDRDEDGDAAACG